MSRIYFHSPDGTAEIYGRERAWMGGLTENIARGLIADHFAAKDLVPFLPPGAFPLDSLEPVAGSALRFTDALGLWMRGSFEARAWVVNGQEYDCWALSLNTCLAVGSNALKLCARLHGQCEIHCYVGGPNRPWLAGIVRQGVRDGLMRDGGSEHERGQWTRLAAWIEAGATPVVCSYSVCNQFPNTDVAAWEEDEEDTPRWYALAAQDRWERSMTGLRASAGELELKPDNWQTFRFGHEKDAFWLWEQAHKERNQP